MSALYAALLLYTFIFVNVTLEEEMRNKLKGKKHKCKAYRLWERVLAVFGCADQLLA